MGIQTVQMGATNYSVICARTRPSSLVSERPTVSQIDRPNVYHKEPCSEFILDFYVVFFV